MLPKTHANPDLVAGESHRPHWNEPENRRHGFHNLHRIARYGQSYRAGSVLQLETAADLAIARRDDVARHCASPWFSAMVVARGKQVLFERHAADFPRDQPHSIMSISKTVMMLEIGRLWAAGKLGLEEKLGDILPWAGAGYAAASVQDVLNMNVLNDYSEDYADPLCRVFEHEAATGFTTCTGSRATGKAIAPVRCCNWKPRPILPSPGAGTWRATVPTRGFRRLWWRAAVSCCSSVTPPISHAISRTRSCRSRKP